MARSLSDKKMNHEILISDLGEMETQEKQGTLVISTSLSCVFSYFVIIYSYCTPSCSVQQQGIRFPKLSYL